MSNMGSYDASGNPIPVVIFPVDAARQPCGDQIRTALPKALVSMKGLGAAVRDRLAQLPGRRVTEIS